MPPFQSSFTKRERHSGQYAVSVALLASLKPPLSFPAVADSCDHSDRRHLVISLHIYITYRRCGRSQWNATWPNDCSLMPHDIRTYLRLTIPSDSGFYLDVGVLPFSGSIIRLTTRLDNGQSFSASIAVEPLSSRHMLQ